MPIRTSSIVSYYPSSHKGTGKRIPEFASRAEEAEFWDTHSLADY
jgi:hypothetical protein